MMSNMCNLVLKEVAVCTRGLQTPSQQWGPRFFMRSGPPVVRESVHRGVNLGVQINLSSIKINQYLLTMTEPGGGAGGGR